MALAAAAICALALALAPSSIAVGEADRANVHAFVLARYEYARALSADAGASAASYRHFAEALTAGCRGVLLGAPGGPGTGLGESFSARARGRSARRSQEFDAVELELSTGEVDAIFTPAAPAREALIATESGLRWADPRLAALATEETAREREDLVSLAPAQLCTDLREWRASGFRSLPADMVQRDEQREAHRVLRPTLETAIAPLEDAADRALVHQTERLSEPLLEVLAGNSDVEGRLHRALGLHEPLAESREREVTLAKGTTASGDGFEVRGSPRHGRPAGCALEASVELTPPRMGGALLEIISTNEEGSLCLRGRRAGVSRLVRCENGVIEVAAAVPAGTRRVRLVLSDGRSIVSRPALVAPRVGGPALVYVQAVRGPAPIPVALVALGALGAPLRTLALHAVHGCRPEPAQKPPVSETIVRGTAPDGRQFAIEGFSFSGLRLDFGARERSPLQLILIGGPRADSGGFGTLEAETPPLDAKIGVECPPAPYALIYGVLAAPGREVLAQTAAGLVPLTLAPIPAPLHPRGVLVYGFFPTLPSQLIVKGRDGRTLRTIALAHKAREEADFCAGYAEG